jgi:hypothetical protein
MPPTKSCSFILFYRQYAVFVKVKNILNWEDGKIKPPFIHTAAEKTVIQAGSDSSLKETSPRRSECFAAVAKFFSLKQTKSTGARPLSKRAGRLKKACQSTT